MLYKGNSKVAGQGLYSSDPIEEGEYLGRFEIALAVYLTKFTIWVEDTPYRALGVLKYANHSRTPNVYVDGDLDMYALSDINPHKELVWDYGECFNPRDL